MIIYHWAPNKLRAHYPALSVTGRAADRQARPGPGASKQSLQVPDGWATFTFEPTAQLAWV